MQKKLKLCKACCDLRKPGRYSLLTMLVFLFLVSTLGAQSLKVSGVVKTAEQEPLASVSVKVKNSQIGTMTD